MITPLPCVELTFGVGLGVTGVSAQPLKQRSHHFGAAEALEPGPNVLVVPFQSADLQDPGKRKPRKLDLGNGKSHLALKKKKQNNKKPARMNLAAAVDEA